MYAAEKTNGPDRQTKTVTLLICLLPLLRYYIPGLKPVMFSDIVQLYLVFLGITNKNVRRDSSHIPPINALLLYGAYVVFVTALSAIYMPVFELSSNVTTIMRLWIYILTIAFTLDSYFDKEFWFQIALKIAVVNSCLTTVQLILFTVLGIRTSFLIPFLDAEAGYSNERVYQERLFRPTGLFYEPAQSVYFFLPLLLILLFSSCHDQKAANPPRHNIVYAIILTVGMMCTESGAGAVILLAVWALFALYMLKKSGNKKMILPVTAGMAAVPFIFRLEFFAEAFSRGTNITQGSGGTRILRGFLTWVQFPLAYKIFGIGYANYSPYVHYSGFSTEYDFIQDVGYTNAAGQILSGMGIIGALLLLVFFYRTYQCSKRDLPSAILILYLFVSLFYSGIFMGIFFMVYMAFIFSRTKPGDSSESEQKE